MSNYDHGFNSSLTHACMVIRGIATELDSLARSFKHTGNTSMGKMLEEHALDLEGVEKNLSAAYNHELIETCDQATRNAYGTLSALVQASSEGRSIQVVQEGLRHG